MKSVSLINEIVISVYILIFQLKFNLFYEDMASNKNTKVL